MNYFLWTLFILCLTLLLYNYLLYPLFIYIYSRLRPIPHQCYLEESEFPSLCLIIPAISDIDTLRRKVENTLKLYYPKDRLLILAISDKDNEKAQELLREYKKYGIINFSKRGMPAGYQALNIGAKLAKSTIIVFSDIDNEFNDLVLTKLVRHFKDPTIAAVSGVRNTIGSRNRQASLGDSFYWKYETLIKKAESDLGSVTAAAGEIMAIRRELYTPIDKDTINFDAALTFNLVNQGYRVIIDDEAVSLTEASEDINQLYRERVQKSKGSFQTLFRQFSSIIPPKTWFAFTFVSHKLIRWLAPFLLLAVFIIPFFLLDSVFMQMLVVVQMAFYLYGVVSWLLRNKIRIPGYANFISYFVVMNTAMFIGLVKYLLRR